MSAASHRAGSRAAEENERNILWQNENIAAAHTDPATQHEQRPRHAQHHQRSVQAAQLSVFLTFILAGILFVQISQQDIENFKKEYESRQKDGGVKRPELET